jgi:hypothetical protein
LLRCSTATRAGAKRMAEAVAMLLEPSLKCTKIAYKKVQKAL